MVVLNWNGLDWTRRCLQSLRRMEYSGTVEVVVVDNGSEGDEADVLAKEYPEVSVMPLRRNVGYGAGCNAGIARAREGGRRPYVLLLNNDATLWPTTLAELVTFMESTPDAGAASPLILFQHAATVWSAGGRVSVPTGSVVMNLKGVPVDRVDRARVRVVDFAPGACLLLSPHLSDPESLLDEAYFAYWEDVDLCYRIRASGRRCYVVTSSTAEHAKSASTGAPGEGRFAPLVSYYLARNAFRFGRARLSGPTRVCFFISQLVPRAPYMLLRRTSALSRVSYVAGVRDGLLGRTGERKEATKT